MASAVSNARGPYAKTAALRSRILDACAEVFALTGYRATTMKEIAERAGISEGGLAHHFASKAELLGAVLDRREEQATQQVGTDIGLDTLLSLIAVVAEDSAKPGIVELHAILSAEATSAEHPAHEHYRDRYDGFRRFATRVFEVVDEAGELRSELSPEDLAASYLALSDGLQLQWLYDRDAVAPAAILERFLQSVVPSLRFASLARAGGSS